MKYLSYMRIEFLKNFQYRTNYWATIANSIIAILIQQALWTAVYRASPGSSPVGGEIAGIGLSTMLTYALVGRVVSGFLTIREGANFGPRVRTGAIIHDLVKPVDLHVQSFFQNLGSALFRLLAVGGPLFAIMVFLGWIEVPPWKTVALFALSLFAGHVTLFATVFASNLASFRTKTGVGIDHVYTIVLLLSGDLVPVDFFPTWLQAVSRFLPFRSVHYVPVAIWSGIIAPGQVMGSFVVQVFWTASMILISRIVWARSIKHLTIQGG